MSQAISTLEEFENKVLNTESGLVLVDFHAQWCGPCRVLSPIIEQLAQDNKEKLTVYKVDIDELRELAIKYEIMSIPTVLFFSQGQLVDQALQGVLPQGAYQEVVDKFS